MTTFRSLIYQLLFYPGTLLFILLGFATSPLGQSATIAVVRGWARFHGALARGLLGINDEVEGPIPDRPSLFAIKHQSMYETIAVLRLIDSPIIVLKRELDDLPLFGWMTRKYGAIAVDREAGAKALRELVARGRAAARSGRSIVIFPEGTRVPVGQHPPLKPGFAALYRAIGLPVVPVAIDAGRLWGHGVRKRPGTITWRFGPSLPPGLPREEIEGAVHEAINVLDRPPA